MPWARSTGLALVAAAVAASCALRTGGLGAGAQSSGTTGADGSGGGAPTCGAVDCANPACAGLTCTLTPAGWTNVVFAPDPAFTCPAGYPDAHPLMEADAKPGDACGCTCGTPDASSCAQGNVSWSLGVFCLQGRTAPSDGGCDVIPGGPIGTNGADFNNPFGKGQMKPLPPQPVTCGATTTLPPLGVTGVACLPAGLGSGCAAGETCLPTLASAPTACVMQPGAGVACPPSFATTHTLYAPGDVADARSCGACACSSQAGSCSNPVLTTYDDSSCTLNPISLTADGNCDALSSPAGGNDSTSRYFRYTATPDTTACTAAGPVPVMGAVTANNPVTVCCP